MGYKRDDFLTPWGIFWGCVAVLGIALFLIRVFA